MRKRPRRICRSDQAGIFLVQGNCTNGQFYVFNALPN